MSITRLFTASAAAVVAAAVSLPLAALQAPPSGRGARSAPAGPAPRTPDGHPDLHGVWLGGGPTSDIEDGIKAGDTIPYSALGKKTKESRLAKDDPEANCLPAGVPRIAPYPWRILTTPSGSHMYFLFEGNIHSYRQIFMDGRKHPEGDALNPTWYGHSVGRWEGDTLVIDTVGFNDRSWFDFVGNPHSDQLHVIERYTRQDGATMTNEITIDDPVMYTRPWKVTFTARARPDEELMEYICQENEKDSSRLQGPAIRDIPKRPTPRGQ
jgi:hypothetical protein